ncbi:MAG: hypothetical protein U0401_35400 [Anaerolineae bacterium]
MAGRRPGDDGSSFGGLSLPELPDYYATQGTARVLLDEDWRSW